MCFYDRGYFNPASSRVFFALVVARFIPSGTPKAKREALKAEGFFRLLSYFFRFVNHFFIFFSSYPREGRSGGEVASRCVLPLFDAL